VRLCDESVIKIGKNEGDIGEFLIDLFVGLFQFFNMLSFFIISFESGISYGFFP